MPGSLSISSHSQVPVLEELVAQESPPRSLTVTSTSIHTCNLHSYREHGLCFLNSKHSPEQPLSLSYIRRGNMKSGGRGPWLCELEALLICNKER